MDVQFFNRYTQALETEQIYGEKWLRWAYENPLGRLTTELAAKRAWFSRWYGWKMNQPKTRERIRPFIENFGMNAGEFVKSVDQFTHFNDFFARALKPEARPIDSAPDSVVFPADGRHLGFQNLEECEGFFVKGATLNLRQLLGDDELAERFAEGSAILSRLCPVDYHRFHTPVAGVPGEPELINGPLYSVNPIALRRNLSVLWQNKRMLTKIETKVAGLVLTLEIGATNVGSIHEEFEAGKPLAKGELKGWFLFGGSATMTFFEPGRVQLADDLRKQSSQQIELYARMGDRAGRVAE